MKIRNIVAGAAIAAVLVAGVWYAFFSGADTGTGAGALGQGVGTEITPIGTILADPSAWIGKTVTVDGQIKLMCASSGCWWYTQDATGRIRVDSFGAGFALPLNQAGRRIISTGKVVGESGEIQIAATGAQLK